MLIDFHTHIFPEAIAPKAINNLSRRAGGTEPFYNGTKEGLIAFMDERGVDLSVVLNIATNPGQQRSVNDFAASVNGGRLMAFGSVHPESPDALDEVDRIIDLGLQGIKFHPDYQQFYGDDKKVFPLYEKIAKKELVVVFHAGVDIGLYPPVYLTPKRLKNALAPLCGAKVVAAHFGGYMMWEEVLEVLCGQALYLDTAYSGGVIPPKMVMQIIRAHGADKILFGSDLPWSSPKEEMGLIKSLDLDQESRDLIFYKNAKRLLKID